jgi:CDP-diacylglycerol---serine O-phosphatidyltransferase
VTKENGQDRETAVDEEFPELTHKLPVGEHFEEVEEAGRKVRRRGVFLLPNLFTLGALFAGFYAMIAAMNGHFDNAALAIVAAGILDGIDGRVARLTNTQSAFGAQLDSLSDMVSFGVAPALVAFHWALGSLGRIGWALAFIYMAAAALRLARFNTQLEKADKRFFTGLASPAAAGVVASMVWLCSDYGLVGEGLPRQLAALAGLITGATGVLMVTNLRYYSFKDLGRGRVPFAILLLVPVVFAIITVDPPLILLVLGITYALSGPVAHFWQGRHKARQ